MGRHVNTEVRCEMGTARPKEGISQEVMSRISGSHGVNWEGIFRLLFPGAPIPSPCKSLIDCLKRLIHFRLWFSLDYEPDLAESIRQSSPQSEDLRRYEAYNRDALPFLVDASLRCAVNARNEPITEEMRTLVVNIVRNCQVASAHNWELRTGSSISTVTLPQAASQRTNAAPETEDEYHESSKARTSKSERSNFVKFPGLDNDTVLPGPENPGHDEDHSSNPVQITNLDLESLFEPCRCSCHHSFGLNSTLGSRYLSAKFLCIHWLRFTDGFCESCTINHTDMGFSELHNEIDSNSDEMVGRSVMNQIFEWSPWLRLFVGAVSLPYIYVYMLSFSACTRSRKKAVDNYIIDIAFRLDLTTDTGLAKHSLLREWRRRTKLQKPKKHWHRGFFYWHFFFNWCQDQYPTLATSLKHCTQDSTLSNSQSHICYICAHTTHTADVDWSPHP